jgi:hypothetical protein
MPGIGIEMPALDAKTVIELFDRDRFGLVGVFLGAAERVGVHEREMGKVAEVVDDQQPVRLVMHIAGKPAPFGIGERRIIDDQTGVGLFGIPRPDPDQVVTFDGRIAAHAQFRRDHVLAGNLDALARRVELHAVIHAPDIVALDAAHRERRRAMATAIVERDDFAARAPIQHDRPLQQHARQLGAVDQFVIPGRDIPGISQEDSVVRHVTLAVWRPACF